MRRLLAVLVAVVFAMSSVGVSTAQDKTKTTTRTAAGTVKVASGDGVVVVGKSKGQDAEWTFGVDGKTKIKRGGKDVSVAELKPGDAVSVRYMEHDGKSMAQTITVTAKRTQP